MTYSITELIASPEKLADKTVLFELQQMIAAFPYFQTARFLYLKGLYLMHDPSFGEELRQTALYVADRKVLFDWIEGDYYKLKPVPRKRHTQESEGGVGSDRTLTLIDAFLESIPASKEEEALSASGYEDDGLSADYTSYILREEDFSSPAQSEEEGNMAAPMKGQHLIDQFIRNTDENTPPLEEKEVEDTESPETEKLPSIDEDDGYFTETLAKIYIKQQRYSKALEIIRRLSLKYPKKNAYFADQIRFLEKLVINKNDK